MTPNLLQIAEGMKLFLEADDVLSEIERHGVCYDEKEAEFQIRKMEKKKESLMLNLLKSDEGILYHKIYGENASFSSQKHLPDFLYNHLGLKSDKITSGGAHSVDAEVLQEFDHPFTNKLLEIRKISKLTSTYLKGYLSESVNGKIHPSYNLHLVKTYRSSSSDPNFQNIPKRDKETAAIVRRCIIPSKDHLLMEADFSGMEVRVAACYNKDPNLIAYLCDPSKDMHRDAAMDCYKLTLDEVNRSIRQEAKGDFVFAQFYGSYYALCADSLWKNIKKQNLKTNSGIGLYEHLKNKGLETYKQFEKHIERVEKDFWNKRFPVYKQWKEKWYEDYLRRGFFHLKTGFICQGYMKKNETINYAVQGAAFHCLLWTLITIHKEMRHRKMGSFIVGQIHDSLVIDVHPDELNELAALIKDVATKQLAEHYKWIIVPMDIEISIAPINESWNKVKEIHSNKCHSCLCGWGYKKKNEDRSVTWECPLCGDKTSEYEKEERR